MAMMTTPPPPPLPETRKKDADQLRLLAVFHHVKGGLSLLMLLLIYVHYLFMSTVFDPAKWAKMDQAPPPGFFEAFRWIYGIMGVVVLAMGVLHVLSGLCIARRKCRMFSLVLAGLDLVQIPLGTALGVCTLVVLLRDSVREEYERVKEGR